MAKTKYQPSYILLWIIGTFQPISRIGIHSVIQKVLSEMAEKLDQNRIKEICNEYVKIKAIVKVSSKPDLYSLSSFGNSLLSEEARRSRDKSRFYLLNYVRRNKLFSSCDVEDDELGDVTSSMMKNLKIEGSEAKGFSSFIPRNKTLWPRYSQQFDKTGKYPTSHDNCPKYLSFYKWQQILVAKDISQASPDIKDHVKLDMKSISIMLGISSQLIGIIIFDPHRYYRKFTIPKKAGGEREIYAPRVFLKVIQRFLLDYYLSALNVHPSVNSFVKNKSVFLNAKMHQAKAFVGTIDIENYFGSITKEMVVTLLKNNGYAESEALLIAKLCTLNGVLPQGAPTSPILSNALLYQFDKDISNLANKQGLTYSRYADDLTISGDDKKLVKDALNNAKLELNKNYSLKINDKKTRILSSNSRQIVTGLVVNEKIQPPRNIRHRIRAAFHNATKSDHKVTHDELKKLSGYYGYLSALPSLRDSPAVKKYKKILANLNKKASHPAR